MGSSQKQETVDMMLGDFPKHQQVRHRESEVSWRVEEFLRDESGDVVEVVLRKIGGAFNNSTVTIDARSRDYIATGKRSKRKRVDRTVAADDTPDEPDSEDSSKDQVDENVDKSEDSEVSAAKKTKKSTKGVCRRGAPQVDLDSVDLDPRNPFKPKARNYAYFQAFLDGDGEATFGDLVQSCINMNERLQILGDSEDAIVRDLHNQVYNWQKGKWGLTVERDDEPAKKAKRENPDVRKVFHSVLSVVKVQGEPWNDFISAVDNG